MSLEILLRHSRILRGTSGLGSKGEALEKLMLWLTQDCCLENSFQDLDDAELCVRWIEERLVAINTKLVETRKRLTRERKEQKD